MEPTLDGIKKQSEMRAKAISKIMQNAQIITLI